MRKPEDSRVSDWDNRACEPDKLFCAVSESIFVLSVNAMFEKLLKVEPPARLRPTLSLCSLHPPSGRTGEHIQTLYRIVPGDLEGDAAAFGVFFSCCDTFFTTAVWQRGQGA